MLTPNDKNKFVLFIYTALPGYMFSCINKLASEIKYKVILVETSINKNYPIKFSSKNFDIINFPNFNKFIVNINNKDIVKVFITGWANKRIIKIAYYFFKQKARLVLFSDQAKKNNIRQKFGKVFLKSYLNKFEKIIVPGKSGYDLMIYYGVPQQNISTDLYTADDKIFNEAKIIRDSKSEYPRCFLFDGQFIKRKGFPFLINEYLEYVNISKDPWKLTIVGKGNLEKTIPQGIENLGFVKQIELKEIYANAGCFILPSLEDHWGVVIHQAAASGLPLLISPYCVGHHEFLRENTNGYFIDPFKPGSLVNNMLKIENTDTEKLKDMGEFSFNLSKSLSIDKWVGAFKALINE